MRRREFITLVVVGAGGRASSAWAAPPPRLTSYAPVTVYADDKAPQSLLIIGSRLQPGLTLSVGSSTPGMIVESGRISDVQSASFIWTALLPVAGTLTLRVRNPDGKVSNTLSVTVMNRPIIVGGSVYGPQRSITCSGTLIAAGSTTASRQTQINAGSVGQTFCLEAGLHSFAGGSNTPKSGQSFIGQYGAICDGTGWSTADANQGAFMAHLADIDDVTIKNLVIQNMPKRGIHAYPTGGADRWNIDYCEIKNCGRGGVMVSSSGKVRFCSIHHCLYAGYESAGGAGDATYDTEFQDTEIAYCGDQQKILFGNGVCFRRCYVHHNDGPGIWYDGENINSIIEDCIVEYNTEGIFYEVSYSGIIRRNISRYNSVSGIFISVSQDVQAYENTLLGNLRGIQYGVDISRVGGGGEVPWSVASGQRFDLKNNATFNNRVRLTHPSHQLNTLVHQNGDGTPYENGSKNLTFETNNYYALDTTSAWLVWGNVNKTFTQWQALGHDDGGSIGL